MGCLLAVPNLEEYFCSLSIPDPASHGRDAVPCHTALSSPYKHCWGFILDNDTLCLCITEMRGWSLSHGPSARLGCSAWESIPSNRVMAVPGRKTAFFLSNEWEDGKMPGCCYYISQSPSEILRHRQACQLQDDTAAG